MFQVLIVILIVILVILASIVWYQHRVLKQVQGMMVACQQLRDKKIEEQLKQADQLQLTGDAKKELDKLQASYNNKIMPQLKAIRATGQDLQRAARTTKLLTIGGPVNDLRADLAKVTTTLKQVEQSLQHIERQSKAHKQAIDQIKQNYQKFHQQLNEKRFEYGDSAKKLNERLADLEKQYDHFVDLTRKGDQEAAQEVLTDLQQGNQELATQIKRVPALYKPLVTEFPDQLRELASGYETLTTEHYHFTESDLDSQIKRLQTKVDATMGQLNDLQLDVVKQANDDLAEQIDHVYAVMQKEIDACDEAHHLIEMMGRFTQHAQHQNNELIGELDRLSLSYTLNNNEFEQARQLNEQIKMIVKQYNEDQQAIRDRRAVYSQIVDREKANRDSLTDIEQEQGKINDAVAKLQTDEQRARKMLQQYSVQIRTIRRQVEQLNLPGVSQEYMDYFFGVSDEIKKLADELNEYKINMENVTKQLIMVEADLEKLQDKTNDLRDSAELTERLQQYANRFAGNEKVAAAAKKSQQLFDQYNYAGSLETIATALEEVEPGSYKRLEDSYYQEVNE
ncbi:septation ring formation regulator EzrA [Limosilactobacillus pontis]|uniref:septation ring formation regulator EzrA n=1 Tax=Limosilactobacillus pontis TaxID=35787 RepID=UPI00241CAA9B|nr:septation ring formation regulator EzrA [Limosilactobacillus pontis]